MDCRPAAWFDDDDKDTLKGQRGRDWFFALVDDDDPGADRIIDKAIREFVEML